MNQNAAMSDQSSAVEQVKWNEQGLAPAIAQDAKTGDVLMLAWMNAESLQLTLDEGIAVYWSRSRQKIWRKGESSGHTQVVKEVRLDCDQDCILLRVDQLGGIACHTGRRHCFFNKHEQGEWVAVDDVVKSPEDIYG